MSGSDRPLIPVLIPVWGLALTGVHSVQSLFFAGAACDQICHLEICQDRAASRFDEGLVPLVFLAGRLPLCSAFFVIAWYLR